MILHSMPDVQTEREVGVLPVEYWSTPRRHHFSLMCKSERPTRPSLHLSMQRTLRVILTEGM